MKQTPISNIQGISITSRKISIDSRGSFVKIEPKAQLEFPLTSVAFSTNPKMGTLRGLHFQTEPYAEEKIVSCVQGSIYDILLDIRPDSKTLGMWAAIEISSENNSQIYIPKGIAHGFQTLEPDSIVQYCLTSQYSERHSYSINPLLYPQFVWPHEAHFVSPRDTSGITLEEALQVYRISLTNITR